MSCPFIRCVIQNRGVPFLRSCCLMFKNSRFPLIPFRYSAHVLSPILLPRRLPNGKLRKALALSGLAVACYQRKSVYELMEAYISRTRHYFSTCVPDYLQRDRANAVCVSQRITFDSLRKRELSLSYRVRYFTFYPYISSFLYSCQYVCETLYRQSFFRTKMANSILRSWTFGVLRVTALYLCIEKKCLRF